MLNKAMIMGRLGNDPELKYTANQTPVCNLSVATSKKWVKDGQKQEVTSWHKVVVYGKQAENCNKFLAKGREVFIEGELNYRSYENKDGIKVHFTEIIANLVQFVGSNKDANSALKQMHNALESNEYKVESNNDFTSDDIPF